MTNFEELKNICNEKWYEVMLLKKKMDIDIMQRDVGLLIKKIGNFDTSKHDMLVNNSVEITIDTTNGILKILDKKNNLYQWNFGVYYNDFMLRMCDIFIHNNKSNSVSLMEATDNIKVLSKIEEVIEEYNETIAYFKDNIASTHKYKCRYFSRSESKKCEDIFEVYNAVINHEIDKNKTQNGSDEYQKTPYGHKCKYGKSTITSVYDERWMAKLVENYFNRVFEREFGITLSQHKNHRKGRGNITFEDLRGK